MGITSHIDDDTAHLTLPDAMTLQRRPPVRPIRSAEQPRLSLPEERPNNDSSPLPSCYLSLNLLVPQTSMLKSSEQPAGYYNVFQAQPYTPVQQHGSVTCFPLHDPHIYSLRNPSRHSTHQRARAYNDIKRQGYAFGQPDGTLGLTRNLGTCTDTSHLPARPLVQQGFMASLETEDHKEGEHDVEILLVDMEAMQVSEDYDSADYDTDEEDGGVGDFGDHRGQTLSGCVEYQSEDYHADMSGSSDEEVGSDAERRQDCSLRSLHGVATYEECIEWR